MENKLEYEEWTQNRFTREMRLRFESEARQAHRHLLAACKCTEDQTVKGAFEKYTTALTMVRACTGVLDHSFLNASEAANGSAA